ncbi:hypothetical protein [Photobacterium damselae]|uniref:hypothetical protein n=1 Tax=Photobacterium damselae TaxID=38293 RepID=UPI001F38E596|nr:hypothetical protein [Photobacterium damselae]UKA04508.1 hypothetical protein IHC89_23075 [Photobacterium damselae subsp. damselae]
MSFWENDECDSEVLDNPDVKFERDFSTVLDVELPDYMSEMIEHSLGVLTFADVLESGGRYVPRKVSLRNGGVENDAGGFVGGSIEGDATAYIESNYEAVVGCMMDMRKYLQSNDRFKPELVIYTKGHNSSSDKRCCLNIREFLKNEKLMASQSLFIQSANIDFQKVKLEWKNLVMARLIEEVATCYMRFAKKELVMNRQIVNYPHNEFFLYGKCWGAAYLCLYDELIKPRVDD